VDAHRIALNVPFLCRKVDRELDAFPVKCRPKELDRGGTNLAQIDGL
jgi:hypothetical protein